MLKTQNIFFVCCLFLISCGGDESNVAMENAMDSVDDLTSGTPTFSGSLVSQNGYTTEGDVQIFFDSDSNQYSLVIDNFSSDDGPALFVYLSQGPFALNFTNLGALKALNGRLRYDFPASQFDPEFDHVVIWCEQVSQSFGVAELSQ